MKRFLCLAVLFAGLTARAQSADEAMPGYDISPTPGYTPVYTDISGPMGWTFQTETSISVTALGAFSVDVQGRSLEVGLWDSSGTLLASDTVTSSGMSVNNSIYESIAPVTLTAGNTYYIAVFSPGFQTVALSPNILPPDGSAEMSPDIQLGTVAWENNGTFEFPDLTSAPVDSALIGANFEFQPVPEPSVICLAGLGSLAVLAVRRRMA